MPVTTDSGQGNFHEFIIHSGSGYRRIGGFFGAGLAKGGEDVHFLMRSGYRAVKAKGLLIHSQLLYQLSYTGEVAIIAALSDP